jgi:hypothetical protein
VGFDPASAALLRFQGKVQAVDLNQSLLNQVVGIQPSLLGIIVQEMAI